MSKSRRGKASNARPSSLRYRLVRSAISLPGSERAYRLADNATSGSTSDRGLTHACVLERLYRVV